LPAGLICVEPCFYAQATSIPEWHATMNSSPYYRMTPGHYVLVPLVRMWFHVNWFLNSNGDLTVVLNITMPN
jgi:hypothetical protein